ncbi:RraA-like protein [Rhizodiscina lignyota]|uniref:RraA-like protein n=1 Tax=Rhizodiscina lignyota TaxID=1504668 RepID=A0A9P4IPA8_9PEZI|nr:RraA-like protein [Rhizodiscina lignyota]
MASDPIVEELKKFTTCDVSDALIKLKYPHGGFLPDITMFSPQRMDGDCKIVGPAYTVRYVRKTYDFEPSPTEHYIDGVPKGAVVFLSTPAGTVNAVYGGLMSTRAKACGAVGSVIDGRVRDLQEHRGLNYPIFAKSVGTPPPTEVVRVAEVNGTVRFQNEGMDVPINAGDYIIGDLNGVVCLPRELAKKALELMPSQLEADEKMAEDILSGLTYTEAANKHRAHVKYPKL